MNIQVKNTELDTYLKSLLGHHYSYFLSAPLEPTAIRTNTLKSTTNQIRGLLNKYQYDFNPISFNPDGFSLKSDPLPLSHSLAFFEGVFQYQGISSQLPAIVLDARPGERVLDMTAAPGSKSSQLAAMLAGKGELVLNDSSYPRLQGLQTNMQRSGTVNHIVLKQRGENLSRIYHEYFDKVLLDAPCTALGTYFSTSEKYHWWSEKKLEKLSTLQYQLMVSAIKCLRIGGELVYSTCSVAPEENELMIEKIIRKYPLEVIDIDPKIRDQFESGWTTYKNKSIGKDLEKSMRIWPHLHSKEGFFVIKLKKNSGIIEEKKPTSADLIYPETHDSPKIHEVLQKITKTWGISEQIWQQYRFILTKTRLWMINPLIQSIPDDNFVSAGLLLGEERLNGWKLVNGSAQYLSDYITKRRLKLSENELVALFQQGKIKYRNLKHDYYVLEFDGRIIGSLYHEKGEIRIRLPHLFTRFRI
jgi:16S rRNA (cytosine1407-C5)-methyltransferase